MRACAAVVKASRFGMSLSEQGHRWMNEAALASGVVMGASSDPLSPERRAAFSWEEV
jgi:hypothetical protein